ncbi:MAG: glutamate formimidoyltransferase [Culturomica sp.]|jgi:glutamate formiminotransferase/formiminotetrahydrofolate cyclodeaminase|nr:glutamate formimidoyltransferase [Culturomica sp.]
MKQLIECVPNFSEGNDMKIIEQITDAMKTVEGVNVINVDPGKATNRTVVTMVGEPQAVCEAAFRAVKKAGEVIDMSKHKGAHPRFGATDVCPLVPVANISMEETIQYANKLAKRIGEELGIPVYCYEYSASVPERKNLAHCRSGEYEGLKEKMSTECWKPDFGPSEWDEHVARTGAIAVGARNFLVAYNVNLNTTSVRRANSVAFDVRERGRVKREGNPITGKPVKDENGNNVMIPGTLKSVKAIGWYIEEYGIAQISMNLTDTTITPVHIAFDEVCHKAEARGMRVTGSELVGLIPLQSLLDAGRYFLHKQQRSSGVSDKELIKIAVKSMGLDELAPFEPNKKVIEYILEDENNKGKKRLVDMSLTDFTDETAYESPAPGGGSIAACMGAMSAALGTMVANLSSHKRGWDERWEEFSQWAEKGKALQNKLIKLIDEDTNAFNKIMTAYDLPKKTEVEKKIRSQAIQTATRFAAEVPFKTMQLCFESMLIAAKMVEIGNPNSVTDAGVAALAARSGVIGAFLNVKVNASGLEDKEFAEKLIKEAETLVEKAKQKETEILSRIKL